MNIQLWNLYVTLETEYSLKHFLASMEQILWLIKLGHKDPELSDVTALQCMRIIAPSLRQTAVYCPLSNVSPSFSDLCQSFPLYVCSPPVWLCSSHPLLSFVSLINPTFSHTISLYLLPLVSSSCLTFPSCYFVLPPLHLGLLSFPVKKWPYLDGREHWWVMHCD